MKNKDNVKVTITDGNGEVLEVFDLGEYYEDQRRSYPDMTAAETRKETIDETADDIHNFLRKRFQPE